MSKKLIIISTMGRVGSSAAYAAITTALPQHKVLHVHSMNPHSLAKSVAKKGSLNNAARSVLDGLEAVRTTIGFDGRPKIISLVRDKIDRNYSAAFAAFRQSYDLQGLEAALEGPEYAKNYWKTFYKSTPDTWFQNELEDVFGVDVYSREFPKEGWCVWDSGRCDILVLKSEMRNDEKNKILSEFLQENIFLGFENSKSSQPNLKNLYQKFKNFNSLKREEIEEIAASKYMAHFYGVNPRDYIEYHLKKEE